MIARLRLIPPLWRSFGPRWLAYRAFYAAQNRLGWFSWRYPATEWDDQPLAAALLDSSLAAPDVYGRYRRTQSPSFFFAGDDRSHFRDSFAAWDTGDSSPIAEADAVLAGRFRYFSGEWLTPGFPPDWHRDPLTDQRLPDRRHWSRINEFGGGDIKIVWEPGRFGFTFALVRAYWRTNDPRYAEAFWQCVESWQHSNPPQQGVHWQSGQEIALRVMAWCFGLYGFLDAPATTDERLAALAQMVALSGQRIASNLGYALSQQNNHSLSEAAGLYTIGLLFPELKQAERWRQRGREVLESQTQALFYADGAFAQQSLNYQRLALHDLIWAVRLGEICRHPLHDSVRTTLAKSAEFLYQLQDEITGQTPNYGQNDGALILPLDNCDYRDFRPIIQAAHFLATGKRRFAPGPWDEDLLWLAGAKALAAPMETSPRRDVSTSSGYHTLRAADSFAFVRCGKFQHRPGQADTLHVDLWWKGCNIAFDPGTYSYNAPPPWDNPLARTAYHNTVTVDGRDQMKRAGRFMWLPWLTGTPTLDVTSTGGALAYWQGEHDGYATKNRRSDAAAPVCYRRSLLRLGDSAWVILDALDSDDSHEYRLQWLMPDFAHNRQDDTTILHTPAGDYYVLCRAQTTEAYLSLARADADSARGWQAPRYHSKAPALSMALQTKAQSERFISIFSAQSCSIIRDERSFKLEANDWTASLEWGAERTGSILAHVEITGSVVDSLSLANRAIS